jgi:hypothetical protein
MGKYTKYYDSLLLENYSSWDNQPVYIELIDKFVNKQISATEFKQELSKIWTENMNKQK